MTDVDVAVHELNNAGPIQASDLFVLEQDGTPKKLTGQELENWLLKMADGHGGIQSIENTKSEGLVDTYTVTFADASIYTYTVSNGASVVSARLIAGQMDDGAPVIYVTGAEITEVK